MENNNFNSTPEFQGKPSVAPLVLGILSFSGILIPLFGVIFGIVGIILSVKDKKKPNSKHGKTGLILSIIGLVVSVIIWVIASAVILSSMNL